MEEYEWNELVYSAKFSFEPVIAKFIICTADAAGVNFFLSLIGPQEWNKEHIGTFKLNSDKNGYFSIQKTFILKIITITTVVCTNPKRRKQNN
jgi:hypothetical protein